MEGDDSLEALQLFDLQNLDSTVNRLAQFGIIS